jgi:hypothetical protein
MVVVLAAWPAWLRGGTHAPWTRPLLWLGLMALALLVFLSWRRRIRPTDGPDPAAPRAAFLAWRDPVFWMGSALMILLAVQWWNSGRVLFYDSAARAWTYSAPPHAGWPSAITTAEARQMLDWFLPAWVILLALRSPGLTTRGARLVWRLLAFNAGLLALFGIVQYLTGTTRMYGLVQMRPHFFASFGYPNHAGSYFMLTMCMSAGLLAHEAATDGVRPRWGRRIGLGAVFFLSFVGSNLSLSRLAVILSWLLLLPLAALFARSLWPRLAPVRRLQVVMGSLAVVTLAALLTLGLAREAIRKEFVPEQDNKTFMDRETSFRWFQMQSAVRIWRDHPWCGVGGWGYRYLIGHYVPPTMWRKITEGKANVHNDALQFLAEFGLWGAGAMGGILVVLLAGVHRVRAGYPPLFAAPLVGVGLVGLQSLIDLPFRSPAVLSLWLILLAGLPRVMGLPRREPVLPPAVRPQIS